MANFSMPWVQADFERKTEHLTRMQKAMYKSLLEACFSCGGALRDNNPHLARICQVDGKTWLKHREVLLAFFYRTPEGWRQQRIDEDIERIIKTRLRTRLNASKGGLAMAMKWHRMRRYSH